MKKKFFAVIIAASACLCLGLGLTACGGGEEDADHVHTFTVENICSECGKEWEYTEGLEFSLDAATDTYTVTGIGTVPKRGRITVPYGYEGKAVTAVGNVAFPFCGGLTELVLPDSITSVGESAFSYSTQLRKVVFPAGVKAVANYTFYGCTALTEVSLPESVETIGENAFASCRALQKVELPAHVRTVGASAFENCAALESIKMDGVERIGAGAFRGCEKLSSVTCTNALASVGDEAFSGCVALQSAPLAAGVTFIGEGAFRGCGLTELTLPAAVETVGNAAFETCTSLASVTWNAKNCSDADPKTAYGPLFGGCTALTALTVGDGAEAIPAYAFQGCTALTAAQLPASVKSVGENAFYGCTALKTAAIPGASSVGGSAFGRCTALTEMEIPASLTELSYGIFDGCTALKTVTLHDGITAIDANAFRGCSALESISIPQNLTSLGSDAFNGCGKLSAFDLPDGLLSVGSGVFTDTAYYGTASNWAEGVLYIGKHLIAARNTLAGVYTVRTDTRTIADAAFERCNLLTGVEVPAGTVYIGSGAFGGCYLLERVTVAPANTAYSSVDGILYNKAQTQTLHIPKAIKGGVTIPDGITAIAEDAFYGCEGLTGVTIGSGVASIGEDAFYGCNGLTSITVVPANPAFCSEDGILYDKNAEGKATQFVHIPMAVGGTVNIPDGVAAINAAMFDGRFALEGIAVSGENTRFASVDGVLYNKNKTQLIRIPEGKGGTVTVENTVTSLAATAFGGCARLTGVTVGSGITAIANGCFDGCTALNTITVAAENEKYSSEEGVLYNKDKTQLVRVPAGMGGTVNLAKVTSVVSGSFRGCAQVNSIVFAGTTDEWRRLSKGANWDADIIEYTVTCTNGTISQSGTVTPSTL